MNIRLAAEQDAEAWDRYALNHSCGLAYHQFAWKRAVAEAYHFDSRYLLAELNGKIRGILPLIIFKHPFFAPTYISLPYCDVGGCLADDDQVKRELVARAREIGAAEGVSGIELRSGSKVSSPDEDEMQCQKVRMVLELPASAEILLKRFKSKLRSQIKKTTRDGLNAQLGGSELLAGFYQVFAKNMHVLGSPVHSRQWIEAVVKNFAKNVQIGLVYTHDKRLAAAGIILLHGDIVSIPWASSLRCFNRQSPNMLLYWTFLTFASDHGYRYFDFGRSTPGEGTYKFKEQWGAKPVPIDWLSLDMNGNKKVLNGLSPIQRKRVEKCWRCIPLIICNFAGPILRRYISR